ncbi:DNA-directed RNA polymerase III subunit RPC3 [Ixodes scapularis]|nr:DNA-directed RNA polymerase III subunit RPC3 [Ixodes scapularis]
MSQLKIKACNLILKEHFGTVVAAVGGSLLKVSSRSLPQLLKSTDLPASKVKKALMVLIHHNIVDFRLHPKGYVEYIIDADRVLYMLRYPRYTHCAKTLYGDTGELIVEELLQNGRMCMSAVLRKVLGRLQGSHTAEAVRSKFVDLVQTHFLCRVPAPEPGGPDAKVPTLILLEEDMYSVPKVHLQLLSVAAEDEDQEGPPSKKSRVESQPDEGIYWQVNFERFHLFFRDQLLVQAASRRLGLKAGEVVRTLLRLAETRTHPKSAQSCPVSKQEVHQQLHKEISLSQKELDSFLSLLVEDPLRLVQRSDERGGMFCVDLHRGLRVLAEAFFASTVQDRFGAKSCRIFRLLLSKRYLEQKQIEELAMIPARDAKEMTYKMFQEKFLAAQELPRTPDYAPSRMIYLFHVDLPQLSRQMLEWCCQAVCNLVLRREHICQEHRRLLDKKQRVDLILASMEHNKASPEQVHEVKEMITPPERKQLAYVKHVSSKMELSEVQLDETMLLLQLYVSSLLK